ncbi:hypothetical protein CVO76_13465 [Arthrobacter agilis]|uniref:Uncharacterized protein n=1 Tax=Arthrobacter agilis TaxID=37921 RepID=A0A2L0UH01_9MICC|nr:hypothetical protein [Arthrobacter agilis]AUZ88531.1 hypothetical protein CVO76_13465 [Arthrobacter agilis]
METKRERLIFLESMGKRLVKAVGPLNRKSLCVGWSYVEDGPSVGLPKRESGYGLVSVLIRPGRKHVTFAGDRSLARQVESALSGELGKGKLPSVDGDLFEFTREGWEPEWAADAAQGAWEPNGLKCGVA